MAKWSERALNYVFHCLWALLSIFAQVVPVFDTEKSSGVVVEDMNPFH